MPPLRVTDEMLAWRNPEAHIARREVADAGDRIDGIVWEMKQFECDPRVVRILDGVGRELYRAKLDLIRISLEEP